MLVGAFPSSLSNVSENRVVKSDGNCLSGSLKHQHAVSYCTEAHDKTKSHRVGFFVGVIVGILVILVLLGLCIVFTCKRYYSKGISEQHLLHKSVQDSFSAGFSSELIANASTLSSFMKRLRISA
jgi:hypothetical protein